MAHPSLDQVVCFSCSASSQANNSSARKNSKRSFILASTFILILVITRIARRWNQTGQKFAGEPDIARTFFFEHRLVLWTMVGATYLWTLQLLSMSAFPALPQLVGTSIATALTTVAIQFKLAFTNEDSPELMAGIAKAAVEGDYIVSLVARARVVFVALAAVLSYTLIAGFYHKRPNRTSRLLLPFANTVTNPKQQPSAASTIF